MSEPSGQQDAKATASPLFYLSLNPSRPTTIIFLHGFSSSHREYDFVTPYLEDYHLLLPDLPGHSSSASVPLVPFSSTVDLIADLIRSQAKSGRAYVVGLSMGGMLSLLLAKQHPDIVLSVFATGMVHGPRRIPRSMFKYGAPFLVYFLKMFLYVPRPIQVWFCRKWQMELPEGMVEDARQNLQVGIFKKVSQEIGKLDFQTLELPMKTLAIAGAKQDAIEPTRQFGKVLKRGNIESRAVIIEEGLHTWDMQFPKLFADGVKAWFEGKELPAEYVD